MGIGIYRGIDILQVNIVVDRLIGDPFNEDIDVVWCTFCTGVCPAAAIGKCCGIDSISAGFEYDIYIAIVRGDDDRPIVYLYLVVILDQ